MSKQSFKPRTDPTKCRNGCGMMIYLDFVHPEGKTESGKYRPLVYYEDGNNFSGEPHDCPKSEYNQKRAQGQQQQQQQQQQTQSTSTKPRPTAESQQTELYKYLGDVVTAISQKLDYMNDRIDEIQRMVRGGLDRPEPGEEQKSVNAQIFMRLDHMNKSLSAVSKCLLMNQSLADSEAVYDRDKEDGIV